MKQSITANIGGRIFHIDDDAYDSLNRYLNRIRQYFKKAGEADDIMGDIESRISELLFEKAGADGIISQRHIEAVMKEMGDPEVFSPEGETENLKKEYEEVHHENDIHARLFRDPDDKVLGGVCAGFGHYFGIDPLWLRLAFAVSILIFGSGLLLYLILWIIIPLAKSTTDKLLMKGRPVNISNIEESLKQEMKDMKDRFDDLKEEARHFDTSKHANRAKALLHDMEKTIRNFSKGIGHSIKSVLGALLIIITLTLLLGFTISLLGFGNIDGLTYSNLSGLFIEQGYPVFWLSIALLVLIVVPLLSLLIRGIIWLFGLRYPIRGFRGAMAILWTVALVVLFFHGSRIANDFKYRGEINYKIENDSIQSDSIFLRLAYPASEKYDHEYWLFNNDDNLVSVDNHNLYLKSISISIGSNHDERLVINTIKSARGNSRFKARKRASEINYHISLHNNIILIDPEFVLKESVWRNQRIKIFVSIPEGKTLIIDPEIEPFIENHYTHISKTEKAKAYQY